MKEAIRWVVGLFLCVCMIITIALCLYGAVNLLLFMMVTILPVGMTVAVIWLVVATVVKLFSKQE